jgi:excisionase family DNA binding protein
MDRWKGTDMTTATPHSDGLDGLLTISVDRLSEMTSVHRSQIYADAKGGKLKVTKMGRRTLIRVADARAWIDAASAATVVAS